MRPSPPPYMLTCAMRKTQHSTAFLFISRIEWAASAGLSRINACVPATTYQVPICQPSSYGNCDRLCSDVCQSEKATACTPDLGYGGTWACRIAVLWP